MDFCFLIFFMEWCKEIPTSGRFPPSKPGKACEGTGWASLEKRVIKEKRVKGKS